MIARRVAVAIALGAAAPAAPAAAEVVALPRTKAVLDVPAGWQRIDAPALVAAYRGPAALLAVTRAPVPNTDAWRAKTRDAYVDQIERGIAASIRGYRRIARRIGEPGGVPAVDLEATRGDGALVIVRVLMFRTYALCLAIEVAPGAEPAAARAIATAFAPP